MLLKTPKKKKIAIVTLDISGPVKNGGVGTAYAALANILVAAGHDVTIIFVNRWTEEDSHFHLYQAYYLFKGVRLLSLHEPKPRLEGAEPAQLSYATYLFLKEQHFDLIHFPDLQGLGYYCLLAKRQGLAFASSLFCVILHGPSTWHKQGNGEKSLAAAGRVLEEFEKRSLELADVIFAPSRYALAWARRAGWPLADKAYVRPCPFPEVARRESSGQFQDFREIVFFGRLETRKGLEVFCQAISSLSARSLQGRKVVFLGRYGSVKGKDARKYLARVTARWRIPFAIIDDCDRDAALRYLRSHAALAVIPSRSETFGYTTLECIAADVPMIASDIPAFREQIAKKGRRNIFFELNALSLRRKLLEVMKKGVPKAQLVVSEAANRRCWTQWHARTTYPVPRLTKLKGQPLVSICFFSAMGSVRSSLESRLFENQTYTNFEVLRASSMQELMGAGKGDFLFIVRGNPAPQRHQLETLVRAAHNSTAEMFISAFEHASDFTVHVPLPAEGLAAHCCLVRRKSAGKLKKRDPRSLTVEVVPEVLYSIAAAGPLQSRDRRLHYSDAYLNRLRRYQRQRELLLDEYRLMNPRRTNLFASAPGDRTR